MTFNLEILAVRLVGVRYTFENQPQPP